MMSVRNLKDPLIADLTCPGLNGDKRSPKVTCDHFFFKVHILIGWEIQKI